MNLREGATTIACGLVLVAGHDARRSRSMAAGILRVCRDGQRC